MTLLPKVKLKTLLTFPSTINGGTGIDVTKANGAVTVDLDYSEFGSISSIPSSPTSHILTYDTAQNNYVMIPSNLLGGAVAGIADAPSDGFQYGRQSAGWTKVPPIPVIPPIPSVYYINVKDYGAKGDGSTDDTAAFQAATAALEATGGGMLFIPRGTYVISSTLQSTKPIRYMGEGWGYGSGGFAAMAATVITRIRWTGGHTTVFNFKNLFFGFGISEMEIDCGGTAYAAVGIDSCCGGTFEQVGAVNFKDFGLVLLALQNTNSWHRFSHTNWESSVNGNSCIDIDRSYNLNTCHCTFLNTRIWHNQNRVGINIGACDNISWTMTYIYAAPSTVGYSVYVDGTILATFPSELVFSHLEAQNGWYNVAGTTPSPATILGLHQSPVPVLNGTPLVWCTNNGVWNTPNSPTDIFSSATTVFTTATTRSLRLTLNGAQQIDLVPLAQRSGAEITIYDYKRTASAGAPKYISAFAPDIIAGYGTTYQMTNAGGAITLVPSPDRTQWDVKSII